MLWRVFQAAIIIATMFMAYSMSIEDGEPLRLELAFLIGIFVAMMATVAVSGTMQLLGRLWRGLAAACAGRAPHIAKPESQQSRAIAPLRLGSQTLQKATGRRVR